MGITEKDSKELERLAKLIRSNDASEDDFTNYLNLIGNYGLDKELINTKLKEYHFEKWNEFKNARIALKNNKGASMDDRRRLEVDLLGFILAFEMAAGFNPSYEVERDENDDKSEK